MATTICESCNHINHRRGPLVEVAHEQTKHRIHDFCIYVWLSEWHRVPDACPICPERITSVHGMSIEDFLKRWNGEDIAVKVYGKAALSYS